MTLKLLKTGNLLHDPVFIGSLFYISGALQQNKDDVILDFARCCTSRRPNPLILVDKPNSSAELLRKDL